MNDREAGQFLHKVFHGGILVGTFLATEVGEERNAIEDEEDECDNYRHSN